MPDPELRENDVLVQVHAAAVNLLDSKIRNGEFKFILPYRLPLILGNDVGEVVVRVGSRVRRFKAGDQVYARPPQDRIGSFAELISMNEDAVAIMPKKLTMEEAASIPLVGLTAWQALIERAKLKKGQKVLIHASSGGVGTFAIPASEASWCNCSHDNEHGKSRFGQAPRCRYCDRLQDNRFRQSPARLRCCSE
jgi:NADPH:quinone reductase-like Zn-dependent oxidoreductase